MMFRLMYRLKKKHGAVLFAVIAVMALLIAMSTAAYYTARGSYNTVASSYSYSQLYLSAISSADMVSAAIMNEPIPTTTAGNKFGVIKSKVDSSLNPVFASDGSYSIPTTVIYLKSDNLKSMTFDGTTTTDDVIKALSSVESVESGVLDGLTIKISILKAGTPKFDWTKATTVSSSSTAKVEKVPFKQEICYRIETTAYYRGDTITVEDIITNDKDGNCEITTPMKTIPGGGSSFPADLDMNATTGHGAMDADGNVGTTGRSVLVNVKRLDGNMTFHNDITYVGSPNVNNVGNKIDGSLVADGSIYFSRGSVNVSGTDNHWYVGKDFVTTDDQIGTIKLGQNNLYVGGDMILGTQQGVQAEEIFVNGDLYVLRQCTIDTKKLHVNGNIYFTDRDSDGNLRTEALKDSLINVSVDTGNPNDRLRGDFELELGGSVQAAGKTQNSWYDWGKQEYVTYWNELTQGQNVKVGNKYSNIKDGSNYTQINGAESYSSSTALEAGYTVNERDDTQDKYLPVHKEGSLLDAIKENTKQEYTTNEKGETVVNSEHAVYPTYTAKSETYKNSLNLDFSNMEEILEKQADGTTKVVGYSKDCVIYGDSGEELGVAKIKVNGTDMKDVTVNIPYIENGFVLSYGSTNFMGSDISNNATIQYNIASDPDTVDDEYLKVESSSGSNGSGKTMPIVLAANTSGGDFSWKGDSYGSNDGGAYVSVRDDVKVSFEMGNLDTTDNKYKPYDHIAGSEGNIKVPTYQLGTKTSIGSETLINIMKNEGKFNVSKNEGDGTMRVGNTILNVNSIPENNVMIVSNSTKTAFQADYEQTLVGGIMYAPAGYLEATNNVNGGVINIGSVVISDYGANHADYHVKLPKPSDVDKFFGPFTNKKDEITGNPGGSQTVEDTSKNKTFGNYNFAFGDWGIIGSNYVGG